MCQLLPGCPEKKSMKELVVILMSLVIDIAMLFPSCKVQNSGVMGPSGK